MNENQSRPPEPNILIVDDIPENLRLLMGSTLQRYLTLKRLNFDDDIHETEDDVISQKVDQENKGLRKAVEALEKRLIATTLNQNDGNRSRTAEILRIPPRTLRRKMEKYHIK